MVAGLLAMVIGLTPVDSAASEDEDGRAIGRAIEAGEAVPLGDLLERVDKEFQGRVINAELERERHHGAERWIYEIKLLTSEGNVLKLEYDAKTMDLIKMRGRRRPVRHDEDDD